MLIDKEICIGCEECIPYCTVGAIRAVEWEGETKGEVDQDQCVECGVCMRAQVCPVDAFQMPELEWPRVLRAHFSNPLVRHPNTGIGGRGTEEIKTNDVTNRLKPGYAGIAIEMGRPGLATRLKDLETVAMALAKLGVGFEPENPVAAIMVDQKTGKLKDEVLNERVLSGIIEFGCKLEQLKEVLGVIRAVSSKIDTVFTLDLACRVGEDGSIPTVDIAKECGFNPRVNTKTNVGLGRL